MEPLRGRREDKRGERREEERREENRRAEKIREEVTSDMVEWDKGKKQRNIISIIFFLFTVVRHWRNDHQNMTAARPHYKVLMRTRRPRRCSAVRFSPTHSRRSTISTPLNALLKSTSSSSPSSSLTVVTHCVLVILFPVCNEMFKGGDDISDRLVGRQALCLRISLRFYEGWGEEKQDNSSSKGKWWMRCNAILTPYVCRG